MENLKEMLSDDELTKLGEFLIERLDEDMDMQGKDEGIIDISELDGFLTAIVSGPVMIPPSKWMKAAWGDFEPVWDSHEEAQAMLSLMMRHMNDIATTLIKQPKNYYPLFLERNVGDRKYLITDEWCEGYMRGVTLAAEQWNLEELQMKTLLSPIKAFSGDQALETHEQFNRQELENIQNAIEPNVRAIHTYWLARREHLSPSPSSSHTPTRREGSRVGRNDPCPCGSGKKYKKCCLH